MRTLALILSLAAACATFAAIPPDLVNYQGVLRGSNDKPLDGTFDMIFSFHDADTAGNPILLDAHDAAHGHAVVVTGGLFSVQLGSGALSDGSGPGTYTSLEEVFRDHSAVYLEVQVGAETLSPRTRVVSAAYALNATHAQTAEQLSGSASGFYLNTSSTPQTKSGSLQVSTSVPGTPALTAGHGGGSSGVTLARDGGGINSQGADYGGFFADTDFTSYAYSAFGGYGIYAKGDLSAGYFYDGSVGASGVAILGYADQGVLGYGNFAGGFFDDTDSSAWVRAGYSTYKVQGSGSVSFVQNHPYEADKVIVYAAPEGDEVAVYTRGTAQLVAGQARVPLGETFALVADPDIGLTAYVTPVDEAVPLAVVDKSTSEIVVRGPAGSRATFDYIVWGLRIGFDEQSIVQPKRTESPIPAMHDHETMYAENADLRRFNALERFRSARPHGKSAEALDRARGRQLRDAIGVYDRARHGTVEQLHGIRKPDSPPDHALATSAATAPTTTIPSHALPSADVRSERPTPEHSSQPLENRVATPPQPAWYHALPSSGPIEAGDVVALDPEKPGAVKRADRGVDDNVVGVAASAAANDVVDVAAAILEVRVDAGYGAIVPGDLLTSSPTPGAAMRALDDASGPIVGQALEPLESGIGTIRVLLRRP
jgi:hypothetical protein